LKGWSPRIRLGKYTDPAGLKAGSDTGQVWHPDANLDTAAAKPYSCRVHMMGPIVQDRMLTEIARRRFWWMPPEEALKDPLRFVAQVMAMGTDRDVRSVEAQPGSEAFDRVLDHPPAGLFSPRRWN
jgi:hypothetical protein